MMRVAVLTWAVVGVLAGVAVGQTPPPAAGPKEPQKVADVGAELAKQDKLVAAVSPAMVIVEYTLQYDKGDAPRAGGFGEMAHDGEDIEEVVRQDRPLEVAGVLFDGTHVVTADMQIHPRFIKGIRVRALEGKDSVAAKVSSYPKDQNAIILETEKPVAGAKAAAFADKPGPYSVVTLHNDNARWTIGVEPFDAKLSVADGKKTFTWPTGLVVAEDGTAVAFGTGLPTAVGGQWKGSPAEWTGVPARNVEELLGKVEKSAATGIVRATLNFRSPKNNDPRQGMMMGQDGEEGDATVRQALAVAIDAHTVLVLAGLKPTVTARLERIRLATNPPMDATFKASLSDFGAFVATTDKPLEAMGIADGDVRDYLGMALPGADITLQGEKRVATFQERRIGGFQRGGWHGNIYPQSVGDDEHRFMFTEAGQLLAVPVAMRQKAATTDRYGGGETPVPTPAGALLAAVKGLPATGDPANAPLSEAQENRVAWIGVEAQPLSKELAQANGVSDQTSDGETGAVVTYVYPDSPAAKAGVEAGWVLLRVNAPNQPKPIDVRLEGDMFNGNFPWDRLGEAPEEAFDRIPSPWPPVENALIRAITDLGFGTKYSIDFYHDGKVDTKNFTVEEGPANYESGARYKSEPLGITVRDLTYEVRRYLQKKPEDPGVVIGKIEQGSKASIAGLKPYELITAVNDQPVKDVKEFEKLTAGQTEVRLSVKRMNAGRIVKIALDAKPPTTRP